MARRSRISTRMEKFVESSRSTISGALDPNNSTPDLYQLEDGDEECQIKRIVLSATLDDDDNYAVIKLGLYQDIPTMADLDNQSAVIYSAIVTNNAVTLINETTTVRVPRGWHLAVWTYSHANVGATSFKHTDFNLQLNYKVLS